MDQLWLSLPLLTQRGVDGWDQEKAREQHWPGRIFFCVWQVLLDIIKTLPFVVQTKGTMAVAQRGTRILRMRVAVEDLKLDEKEHQIELFFWSTTVRVDVVGTADVIVPMDGSSVAVLLPISQAVTFAKDDAIWIAAATYAPSEEGSLVGGRAGVAMLKLRRLQRLVQIQVTGGDVVTLPLELQLPGVGRRPARKITVRIVSIVREDRLWIEKWRFRSRDQFSLSGKLHTAASNAQLNKFIDDTVFPFTDAASAQGVEFKPSRAKVEQLHAPIYYANIPVATYAFYSEVGDHAPSPSMEDFLRDLSRSSLARHDWSDREFVRVVDAQFAQGGDTYDDKFTIACAITVGACTLPSVSTFYRYDEAFVPKRTLFGGTAITRKDIESFMDALLMSGGDCEDTGAQNHRVMRWLKMGKPELTTLREYWRAYGGWQDPVLDRMQRICYWYVSGGGLGSVTNAHIAQSDSKTGEAVPLIIDSAQDDRCDIGGHMWHEAIPVTRAEDALMRTNTKVQRGDMRPKMRGSYSDWLNKMPHLVGEGTGWTSPLQMPMVTYAHTDKARSDFRDLHRRILEAQAYINHNTDVLQRAETQRYSDRLDPVPDARTNKFYRRCTSFYTDDLALNGLPHFELVWVRMHERRSELAPPLTTREEAQPLTYGVDMRDRLLLSDGVGLVLTPAPTDDEIESFKARVKHLRPWRQPRRSPGTMASIRQEFAPVVAQFNRDIGAKTTAAGTGRGTLVNYVLRRREFLIEGVRTKIAEEIKGLDRVEAAEAVLEVFDDRLYVVRVALRIRDE